MPPLEIIRAISIPNTFSFHSSVCFAEFSSYGNIGSNSYYTEPKFGTYHLPNSSSNDCSSYPGACSFADIIADIIAHGISTAGHRHWVTTWHKCTASAVGERHTYREVHDSAYYCAALSSVADFYLEVWAW
jgi:hypothetical protein